MVNPDVAAYLRSNMDQFPLDVLKGQLISEGISEEDIADSLAFAIRSRKAWKRRRFLGVTLMVAGCAVFLLSAASLLGKLLFPAGRNGGKTPYFSGSLIGHYGFVIGMPAGYVAYDHQPAAENDVETVYFCKNGTSQNNLLDADLYGGLGIVRLEVSARRDPWPANAAAIARAVEDRSRRRKETYQLKDLHEGSLSGVEFVFGMPSPRVEAYVFGQELFYSFYGGQDDAVFRGILTSLRDKNTEE